MRKQKVTKKMWSWVLICTCSMMLMQDVAYAAEACNSAAKEESAQETEPMGGMEETAPAGNGEPGAAESNGQTGQSETAESTEETGQAEATESTEETGQTEVTESTEQPEQTGQTEEAGTEEKAEPSEPRSTEGTEESVRPFAQEDTENIGNTESGEKPEKGDSRPKIKKELKEDRAQAGGVLALQKANFPDANFRNYLMQYDQDGDGVLSAEERARVTSIDIFGYQVSSLKGIEYFPNLKELNAGNNKIKELDLSANVQLKVLKCSNNKRLTTINLTGLSELEELYCQDTQVTDLPLGNQQKLRVLNCIRNDQLTNLTLQNMSALETLYCGGRSSSNSSGLTSLTLSGNPSLREVGIHSGNVTDVVVDNCVNLKKLLCSDNSIRQLNITGCPALERLICGRNQLQQLYLNNLISLKELYLDHNAAPMTLSLSGCSQLFVLQCYESNIANIDLTGCSTLQILNCRENNISNLDLSSLGELRVFDCSSNQLGSLNITGNTKLEKLNCSDNWIAELDLSNRESLKALYCQNNELEVLKLEACPNLQLLNCSDNHLYMLDIRSNTKLTGISCENNTYTIPTGSIIDLRTIPGLELSKVRNWSGGSTNQSPSGAVVMLNDWTKPYASYEYDIKNGFYVKFNLFFSNPAQKTNIANMAWGLANTKCTYNGKNKRPGVYASENMRRGADYKVSYQNNKKIGTATVTIRGIGNYTGCIKKTFQICPAKVKVKSAQGKKSGMLAVNWQRDRQVSGYEIRISTDSKFKKNVTTKTIQKNKTVKATFKRLKKGKKYYVQIRAYKISNGTKLYGVWSKRETCKC